MIEALSSEMKIFILVASSWILAEILKVMTYFVRTRELDIKVALRYGGMPSSHSAFVTGLAVSIYLIEGFSTSFLLGLAIWILVLRDLMVIRGNIDNNTKNIQVLSKNKIKGVMLSHTIKEISVGIAIGILIPLIINYFL
ncbi:divergent PAP2 family protein [Candidatus Woesearchaeota archaeon]|nr:divergent PAP2 family protein [Candidatus Woesearchaeota archaeon]